MKSRIKFTIVAILMGVSFQMNAQDSIDNKIYKSFTDRLLNDRSLMHIYLDSRVDLQSIYNNADNVENSFRANTFRMRIMGEITPGIRYYIRHRLNRTQVPRDRDGFAPATDHAYLQFDAGENFTFSIGKQLTKLGTFEFNANSADIYLLTLAANDLDYYKTGINIAYKIHKHVFNLQMFNSPPTSIASETYGKKALGGALQWEGNIANGLLKTLYGYALMQSDKKTFYSWITIGNQINIDKFTAELDWYYGRQNYNYGGLVGNLNLGLREVQDQSLGLELTYNLGKLKPRLKAIYDKREDVENKDSYINVGFQGAIEYYPFKDKARAKDLRFHLMYSHKRTSFSGSYIDLDNFNQDILLAGFRWYFTIR